MITILQAARFLGVSENAIRDRVKRGTIRCARNLLTNRWEVDDTDLERKNPGRPRGAKDKKPRKANRRSKTTTTNQKATA